MHKKADSYVTHIAIYTLHIATLELSIHIRIGKQNVHYHRAVITIHIHMYHTAPNFRGQIFS